MNFSKKSTVSYSSYKAIILCILSFFCCLSIYAQNNNNEQVKRLQRAIFVFNFAQQVGWQNQQDNADFKIGVLGPDRAVIDFKSLAQKRKINSKSVKVISFNSVKDIKDIQLLYVNKSFNFDINYILNKISGKNILLVTEDFNYNTSMINIVNVGNSFEYEINTQIIEKEKFVIANSLKQYAINSSQKWKALYKSTEASLNEAKIKESQQQEVLKNKEVQISTQKEKINTQEVAFDTILNSILIKDNRINKLSNQTELQQQKFEDKVKIEQELEQRILQQIEFIKTQQEAITSSDIEIRQQLDQIKNQAQEITKKEVTLKQKQSKLNAQKLVNYLLIALIALALIGSFIIYKNYLTKKRLSQKLEVKNLDIQKQAHELASKNDELEQFAYIASHDLKEPLITITSLIDLLVDEYEDKFDEEGKVSLNYISQSSTRMQKLIDAILQYSRLGKSKNITDVNCNTVIRILQNDLKNIIDRTNSKIISSDLPVIKGAELELRLLFQNLISNGIKFTKKDIKPIITIDCIKKEDSSGNHWLFSVEDNGIGIEDKHKERIFSIFQRLHSREEYEGTGIGLAHCKKIVEAHGGTIWLDSIVGKGTTFFFTIPA